MLARVFLVDVPPSFSLGKMKEWLDRFSISSISSISCMSERAYRLKQALCRKRTNRLRPKINIYGQRIPLNVVRGDTEEGHGLQRFFSGGTLSGECP